MDGAQTCSLRKTHASIPASLLPPESAPLPDFPVDLGSRNPHLHSPGSATPLAWGLPPPLPGVCGSGAAAQAETRHQGTRSTRGSRPGSAEGRGSGRSTGAEGGRGAGLFPQGHEAGWELTMSLWQVKRCCRPAGDGACAELAAPGWAPSTGGRWQRAEPSTLACAGPCSPPLPLPAPVLAGHPPESRSRMPNPRAAPVSCRPPPHWAEQVTGQTQSQQGGTAACPGHRVTQRGVRQRTPSLTTKTNRGHRGMEGAWAHEWVGPFQGAAHLPQEGLRGVRATGEALALRPLVSPRAQVQRSR